MARLSALACLFVLLAAPALSQGAFATYDAASEPVLNDPHDLAFGPDGMLYVADKFGHRIVRMDPETLAVLNVIGEGQLLGVHDVSFGPDGRGFAAVTGRGAVARFTPGPDGIVTGGVQGFPYTEGVLAHSNGLVYVMASGAGMLLALDGERVVAATGGLGGAHDVAEALDGSVWVADNLRSRLVRYSPELDRLQVLDDPAFGLRGPRYMDIDPFGRLVVADQDAHRILLIDPVAERLLGVIGDGTPGIGPGRFDDPEGVVIRGSTYYFADSDNNRIVRYVVVLN